MLNFYPPFLCRVLAAILKMADMNLSTADLRNYRTQFHETWWSYRYMFLVDPKVFRFVVIITRYDYNLTIMESPKPATDNRLKK
jgi:hypothetical protein